LNINTPAPTAKEIREGKGKKRVTVESEIPYSEIVAYTFVEESSPEKIKVLGQKNMNLVDNNKDGLIDEVIIFNRTLSENEIDSLLDCESNQYDSSFINLQTRSEEYNFTIYAQDSYGNVKNEFISFYINTEYPNLEFVDPTPGDYISGNTIKINVSVDSASEFFTFFDL